MTPTRRTWLAQAGLMTATLLTGCGGGGDAGDPTDGPTIHGFDATAGPTFVGDRARLTARFNGGAGRVEPDVGPVTSGLPFETPVLDRTQRFTLVVEAPGRPAVRRELELGVAFRDRYVALPAPLPVQYHAAVTAGDGSVLIIGGSRGGSTASEAVDRFDPVARHFERIGSLASGRSGHTATRLAGGQVLVAGGTISLANGPGAEVIDERSGAVAGAGRFVQYRDGYAAVALADGRALMVGGVGRDTVEIWDPATRNFRLVAARMSHPRQHPSATLLADGRVLIVGGYHEAPTQVMAEIFDPRSESFAPLVHGLDERRLLHEAHRLADGRVLIVGGELFEDGRIVPLPSVLRFDPAAGTLGVVRELERARTLVRSVWLPDDQILVFGGQTDGERATASALSYRTNAVRPLAPMPQPRAFHTVSRLPDGRILIVGGDDPDAHPVSTVLIYE